MLHLCYRICLIFFLAREINSLTDVEKNMEFFDVSGKGFEDMTDIDFKEANIPHSRKRRFLAFPSPSTLTLECDLTIPVDHVNGITNMVFESDFSFDLDELFPVPVTTTTTTTTTTTAPSYKAPPAPSISYSAPSQTSSYASNRIETPSGLNRLTFYKHMEDLLTKRGFNGRQCTLRTLCEIAEAPFDHGLYGEVVNMIMSASLSPYEVGGYDDFMAAEFYGKNYGQCHKIYPKCPQSVLDIVSNVF